MANYGTSGAGEDDVGVCSCCAVVEVEEDVDSDCLPAATKMVAVRRNKRRNNELNVQSQGKEEGEVEVR